MLFRSWGCDIINMSTVPEICLARELELEYQSIAMSTDYDCWHESEEEVTMEMIFATMGENVHNVKKLIEHSIPFIKVNMNWWNK
jgi:5'-methylthioadenosine phosphorylase